MTGPEEKARQVIDGLLEQAGWAIQNFSDLNLGASLGVAVREFTLKNGEAGNALMDTGLCEHSRGQG